MTAGQDPDQQAPDAAGTGVVETGAGDTSAAFDNAAPVVASAPVPGYSMALEPPDPSFAVAPVPAQPTGGHDVVYVPAADVVKLGVALPEVEEPPAASAVPQSGVGPSRGGGAGRVIVAVLAGVALIASGLFAFLWWEADQQRAQHRDEWASEVAVLSAQNLSREQEIGRLERELRNASNDLSIMQEDLEGTQGLVDKLRDEQGVVRQCIVLHAQVVDALINDDEVALDVVFDEAAEVCDRADAILGG